MAGDTLFLTAMLAAGAAAQLVARADGLRRALWLGFFWTVSPVLVFVTFLTLEVDGRLARALAAVVVSTWLVAGVGYAYARRVATERDERGALALAAGFGNTGFVGFPLAQLAFGPQGLALAVVYDRLAWLVPQTSVSTAVARLHGRVSPVVRRGGRLGAIVLNPPALALVAALGLRGAGVEVPLHAEVRDVAAAVVGPVGFLLLGLSLPFERPAHPAVEVRRALGAVAIRMAGGPLALLAVATAVGASVPPVFYLLSGMPAAFHLLVLARVYDVRPALMRLLVVGSTVPAVVAVVAGVALAG